MARDLDHFSLSRWQGPLPRRRQAGGGRPPDRERSAHGAELLAQATGLVERFQADRRDPDRLDPRLIFRIRLSPSGTLDESVVESLGLRVIARSPSGAIVVFPDDATLRELRRRISEYAGMVPGGHQYAYLAAIDAVEDLTAEDRTGQRLRREPMVADEVLPLDIELWHTGDPDECRAIIQHVTRQLHDRQLRVSDSYVGSTICLMRARLDRSALEMLLQMRAIKEIDRRPSPSFEMLGIVRAAIADMTRPISDTELPTDLPGILVVDSGVAQAHPLLGVTLGDAQVFPDRDGSKILGGPEDGDELTGGHGTSVAGIAVYGDIGQCIDARIFQPKARLFSARVTDENNEYDPDELVEHQLDDAVRYFLENYPEIKAVNISLGDSSLRYDDGYQFRLAALIDDLAYRYRDREVVFTVSSGNCLPDLSDDQLLSEYPDYLLVPEARIIEPATSALGITVGGLSYGAGADVGGLHETGTERLIAGTAGWPSPFTRTGWGVDGAIKPDVVEHAGDLRYERGRVAPQRNDQPAQWAGLPSTSKQFQPPSGRLFRTVAGTSFAAPRVANLAARLFRDFPGASSNLIRALIAASAAVPSNRPASLARMGSTDDSILKIYGYGQPDYERARWSMSNEVLLVHDGIIDVGAFILFPIPPLPTDFLSARGKGTLSVCLAFDPPSRSTRADHYLGVTMEAGLYRNVEPAVLADALRTWNAEERTELEDLPVPTLQGIKGSSNVPIEVKLSPSSSRRRKKGTLQKGIARVADARWSYDGGPLLLAVTCQRTWAPASIESQRFAVIVGLSHENPTVNLHAQISQYLQVVQRVRVQA